MSNNHENGEASNGTADVEEFVVDQEETAVDQEAGVDEARLAKATATGERVGAILAKALGGWGKLLYAFFAGVLRFVPRSGKIADGAIISAYKFKKKVTNADVLVNTIYGDGVVIPSAGYWQSDELGYKTENGERYSARGIGFDPKLIGGKVPVVWALREGREITEPLEAYMGGQRRRGRYEPHLRPDGGRDIAIDAETRGYDGLALSFRDGWRFFGSKVTQEDMDLAEKRGKIAELEDRYLSNDIKMLLVGAGGLCLGLFGPALAASIAGSGGGAVGGGGLPTLPGLGGAIVPWIPLVLGVF
jgi:hypothetical protein